MYTVYSFSVVLACWRSVHWGFYIATNQTCPFVALLDFMARPINLLALHVHRLPDDDAVEVCWVAAISVHSIARQVFDFPITSLRTISSAISGENIYSRRQY